jgi:hypothetical protein
LLLKLSHSLAKLCNIGLTLADAELVQVVACNFFRNCDFTDMVLSGLTYEVRIEILLLLEMPQQDPSFGHKLSAVAHQANPFKFSVNGIAQLAGNVLLQQDNVIFSGAVHI